MSKSISIITEIPGHKSQELMKRRQESIPQGVFQVTPIFVQKGEGAVLIDVDGNHFLDFAGGIGVMNVGHSNPEVVKAITKGIKKFTHTCFHVGMYEPYLQLAEKLNNIIPGKFKKKTFFANSGAEAVENAIKIARSYTKRQAVVSFEHAFHGRTLLALTLTSKIMPYKAGFGPYAPEVYRFPYPYCYRCPEGRDNNIFSPLKGESSISSPLTGDSLPFLSLDGSSPQSSPSLDGRGVGEGEKDTCNMQCVDRLHEFFNSYVATNSVAAIIIDPVLGEGGFMVCPPQFMRSLREICDKEGIVLIIDEVQTGFGRTGKLFALEHYDVEPDIMLTAKSLGAGMPLSAITGKAEIMDAPQIGGLGGTYGGNPLACLSALAVIKIMEDERFLPYVQKLGQIIKDYFNNMYSKHQIIGDVRGLGAMMAMEIVEDRKTKKPSKFITTEIVTKCLTKGLILITAGLYGNVIRLLMPLTITEEQLIEGLEVLTKAF